MARNTQHPGVSLFLRRRRGGADLYARWRDTATGKYRDMDLSMQGMTTKASARPWAVRLSNELALAQKRRSTEAAGLAPVASVWTAFVAERRRERSEESAKSLESYEGRLWRTFLEGLPIRSISELSQRHLFAFRDGMDTSAADLAPSTRNRHLDVAQAFVNFCRRRKFIAIDADDVRDSLKPFKTEKSLPRVLSKVELSRLIEAVVANDTARALGSRESKDKYYNDPDGEREGELLYSPVAPFFLLCLLTGMRSGEALELLWDDVDEVRGEIRVLHTKTKVDRVVPLHDSPALRRLLVALRSKGPTGKRVLGDSANGSARRINGRIWKRLFKLAGLKSDRNLLRRAAASAVASCGRYNEFLLQMRFGHSTEVANAHYRRAQFGAMMSGDTVEEWLGVKSEVSSAFTRLGW
jgi:integrase